MVTRTKKIFVGGLSAPSTLEDVKNYFEQFGRVSLAIFLIKITSNSVWTTSYTYTKTYYLIFLFQIEDAMLMFDKQTNRHRYSVHCSGRYYFKLFYEFKILVLAFIMMSYSSHSDLRFLDVLYMYAYYLCLCICLSFAGVLASLRLRARTWWTKFARYTSMKSTIKWSVPSE